MATRSIIARKINDKESLAIYCHYDGYLEHNGVILQEYYNTPEKVVELIDKGDLCVLNRYISPDSKEEHTRLNPQKDVCIYYGRDMKNPNAEPVVTDTECLGKLSDWAEHVYFYDEKGWHHSIIYEDCSVRFKPLSEELVMLKPYIELMRKIKEEQEPPTLG